MHTHEPPVKDAAALGRDMNRLWFEFIEATNQAVRLLRTADSPQDYRLVADAVGRAASLLEKHNVAGEAFKAACAKPKDCICLKDECFLDCGPCQGHEASECPAAQE